jgi:hypothetical protein
MPQHKYYEFTVTLVGIEPKIFRRFILNKNSNFNHLHSAIQDACGWENRHLFSFSFENPYKERPPRESVFAVSGWDEPDDYLGCPEFARDVRLGSCFDDKLGTPTVYYLYDFGDAWVHEVNHVATHVFEEKFKRLLLDGERRFPKEDCGSLSGYQSILEFFQTGKSPDSGISAREFKAWLDGWKPEDFDLSKEAKKFNLPKSLPFDPKKLGFYNLPNNVIEFKKTDTLKNK